MLYVQQFQHNRQDFLRQHQRLSLLARQRLSLSSNQYNEKFPNKIQPTVPDVHYSHNQALLFLSRLPSSYMRSTTELQFKTGMTRDKKDSMTMLSKGSMTDQDKKTFNENSEKISAFTRQQTSNGNVYRFAQTATLGNALPTSVLIPSSILPEPDRPPTSMLMHEKSYPQTFTEKVKPPRPSHSPIQMGNQRLMDSMESFNSSIDISQNQKKLPLLKSDNHFLNQSSTIGSANDMINTNGRSSCLDYSTDTNLPDTTSGINDEEELKIPHRSSQCKINGFQHIVNLGSWQQGSKNKQIDPAEKPKEIEKENESKKSAEESSTDSSNTMYEFKNPFSEEYDQAILTSTQVQTNNNIYEWSLKDFYRDVKTPFEPDTNTRAVFEKSLKLARLQANTIKWEQRRRQNLSIYNRLIKSATYDSNIPNSNGTSSSKVNNERDIRDINELKRELRCNECKRLACLGNCAPGQEYHQYKRFISSSSFSYAREQNRCKLTLRTQRSTTDLRPFSTQQTTRETKVKFDQVTNTNPTDVTPSLGNDSQAKRSQKKLSNRYMAAKSIPPQRRETLTFIATNKISV